MDNKKNEVLRKVDSNGKYVYYCPGCKQNHMIDNRWTVSGTLTNPTITPSVLINGKYNGDKRCHSFIKKGIIIFLSDCDHELKNNIFQ